MQSVSCIWGGYVSGFFFFYMYLPGSIIFNIYMYPRASKFQVFFVGYRGKREIDSLQGKKKKISDAVRHLMYRLITGILHADYTMLVAIDRQTGI